MTTTNARAFTVDLLPDRFAICKLDPGSPIPSWADALPFSTISRSATELSIICPERCVPARTSASLGWRALRLHGIFPLDKSGVLVAVATPLARAGISVMAVATFDTDYLLVPGHAIESAISSLERSGHSVDVNSGVTE